MGIFSGSIGGGEANRQRGSGMNRQFEAFQRLLEQLPQTGGLARNIVEQIEAMSPRGPQAQAPGLALDAADTLTSGLSGAEREQQGQQLTQQINNLLGGIAGGGATGASFRGAGAAEAAPAVARAQGEFASREQEALRGGAGQVLGALGSTLTGPDQVSEAFGRLLGQMQRGRGGIRLVRGGIGS